MSVTSVANSVFTGIGGITGWLRDLVTSISVDYSILILLALSGLGSYYLVSTLFKDKQLAITGYWVYVIIGVILFLILRFV